MRISDSLAPGFLIASPKLDDGPFERAVILMIHHDHEGAMGFIINKPLEVDFGSLLEAVELGDATINSGCYQQTVYLGGPVRTEQLWVILNEEGSAEERRFEELDHNAQVQFHKNWMLTGTADSIQSLVTHDVGELAFRPYVGYSGWGPGQLEDEISEGSWLALDFDEELVFQSTGGLWNAALSTLGLDETTFMMMGKGGTA